MKQYLDKDQTAKLIELGFPKPQHAIPIRGGYEGIPELRYAVFHEPRYCLGELIEFLPNKIEDEYDEVTSLEFSKTEVYYTNLRVISYYKNSAELIDALFDMCVTLKEEGAI